MTDSRLWDDAEVYDVATSSYTDDIDYWKSVLDAYRPCQILELACGTGRITFPLARHGRALHPDFRIVGLDRSARFLARAHERRVDFPPELAEAVDFVEADMRSFALGATFDLVFVAYNSFAFLFDIDDQLACLTATRDHLAPGGIFALDLHTPPLDLLVQARVDTFPAVRQDMHFRQPAPGITRFSSMFITTSYDPATQTEETTHFFDVFHDDGRHESYPYDVTWHHFFPRELELLMRMAGLKVVERYGTYERAPFSDISKQYLWMMQAM
jgi:SAM-dependent methyltransferase